MKRTRAGLAVRSFHGLFRNGVSTGLSDRELLDRFARCRDASGELAFATLVARHGPMVLSVCRRMLRDPHDSEDAFQATFLILVRKRAGIRVEASLGPWLYGVSIRVARRARAISARRRSALLGFTGLAAWGAATSLAAQISGHLRDELTQTPLIAINTTEPSRAVEIQEPKSSPEDSEISVPDDIPPVVIKAEPRVGATDVDPGLKEIRVTFSKKMTDKSWSWPTGNKYAAPADAGPIHFDRDRRTCVLPVKLEPGKTYVIGVNSERFRKFKDEMGQPALP